jgi:hypothetical protein
MYGKKTGVKKSLRPKARPKSLRPKARPKGLGSTRHPSNKNMDERTLGGMGSGTRHPTGLNINEQNTIVFKRDKPRGK